MDGILLFFFFVTVQRLTPSRPVPPAKPTAMSLTPPRSESPRRPNDVTSPSAKALLKHLTSSMALKVRQSCLQLNYSTTLYFDICFRAWSSRSRRAKHGSQTRKTPNRNQTTPTSWIPSCRCVSGGCEVVTQLRLWFVYVQSTRTPKKLSRRRVIFKRTPPAAVKYRHSTVDIGQVRGSLKNAVEIMKYCVVSG